MVQASGVVAQAKLQVERARARWAAVDVAVSTFKRYSLDDIGSYAAALTYYIFFSIFPLLLATAAVLGYLTFLNPEIKEKVFQAGIGSFPMLRSALRPSGLDFLADQRGTLAVTSVLLGLYSGSGGVVALQHALNKVWRVATEPNFVGKRIRSLKWLGIFAVGAVVTAGLGGVASFAEEVFGHGSIGALAAAVLGRIAGIAVGIGLFLTAFKFLPARPASWRELLPGAIVAGIVFELLKVAGALYLAAGSESRQATFGAFAAAAGLLVVSYLLAQVTLLSSVLNAVLAERRALRRGHVAAEDGEGK